jgi:hypothetical protein
MCFSLLFQPNFSQKVFIVKLTNNISGGLMKSKVLIAAVIILSLLLTAALGALVLTKPQVLENKITGLLTGEKPSPSSRIALYAELSPMDLNLTDVDYLAISLERQNASLFLENTQVDLSELSSTEIYIEPFKGEAFINSTVLKLLGHTQELSINKIKLSPLTNQELNLRGELNFKSAEFDLSLGDFKVISSGLIKLGNKAQIDLNNDSLELKNFKGQLTFEGNKLVINGTAENVNINSQEFKIATG